MNLYAIEYAGEREYWQATSATQAIELAREQYVLDKHDDSPKAYRSDEDNRQFFNDYFKLCELVGYLRNP